MAQASRDQNRVPTLLGVSSADGVTPVAIYANPITHALLVSGAAAGTVTSVSVVTANGISGSVANPTTTPAITLTLGNITPTTVNGLTLASQAIGFTIAGGTTSKTLTVPLDASVSGTNTGDQTSVSGNAGSATTTAITDDTSTNATMYPTWVTANTGNLAQKVSSTKLTFNPSTATLTATTFAGNASTSTKLAATKNIAGVAFDGSADIAIPITNLSDVSIASPAVNQVLQWNGANWINGNETAVSAGPGVTFFFYATDIVPPGAGPQSLELDTLLKTPSSTGETSHTVAVTAGTSPVYLMAHAYEAAGLGGTQIDGGIWTFNTYANVSALGGPVVTLNIAVNRVITGAGTVTITGAGTSRTATVTGGTPFVSGDANANQTLSGWLQTANGYFPISAFTSTSVVTITTLSTYTNEVGASYKLHRNLFTSTTQQINSTSVALFTNSESHVAFAINASDGLSANYFANNSSGTSRNVTVYHEGTLHNTTITTPLVVRHNDLAGLQGGTSGEYYHLTASEYTGSGTGTFARVSSPVFTTPNIGSATGSVTGNAGTVTGLSVTGGKTLTVSESATIAAAAITLNGNVQTFPTASDTVVTLTATQTLTNKRITKRVVTASDATSITPNTDNADITYQANTQAGGTLTINADSGTPTNGQFWELWIKATNAQTPSFNAVYIPMGVALPTTFPAGKNVKMLFQWDTNTSKWGMLAANTEA